MVLQSKQRRAANLEGLSRSKVEIPRAEQWIMTSSVHYRRYQVMVAVPSAAPPTGGYPVLYVLDGNSVFGTVVEAVRLQSNRPDITGVLPAIVVGIGYPVETPFSSERFYDLTPMPTTEYAHRFRDGEVPKQGGAAQFLQFIEEELKPQIESEFPINRDRQTIFGHSLGGLFAVYTLFTKPHAFQSYIAGSPSIHWNEAFMLEAEQRFVNEWKLPSQPINVMLGVGEQERTHIAQNCARASALAERLVILADQGLSVKYKEFEGEGHVSVLPVLISQGLRVALRP
ncbi:alpha/beta hydrolase-fold protein [Paenibacillus sp. N1-5-1-14]|uniref:alpha/beta hydrolase n=1 Tax=Paenibacillus radicibacter TaxID=2972488 RepID=UPI0021599E41|nr:alpha/beta hydrolase-fold protein [Paenibacillus radicibacter]MCR8642848.1 alpha/beta hydrolase-fold protein [Paenibacillus radicibacter]